MEATLERSALSSLPAPATRLIGRDEHVRAVAALFESDEERLVTLTGPGGVGKTRLAIEAADRLGPLFEDGLCFVPLAAVPVVEQVAEAVAQALGLREADGRGPAQRLRAALGPRRLLLVLDNFEHLLPAAALVSELLAACPEVRCLVTSRTPLHLASEHEYPVPPLAAPDPDRLPGLESLVTGFPAVELFVERARAVSPDFRLDAGNAAAVARICSRLEGMPLAIELSAARTRLLSPPVLASRLGSALAILTGGPRDLPVRQRTLRSTIDWSFNLLDGAAQRALARLAVFVGGCTVGAAESLLEAVSGSPASPLDVLTSLVEANLVRRFRDPRGETRLDLFEATREYALERLQQTGDEAAARSRHAAIYLELAEAAEPDLRRTGQGVDLDRLEVEHDNLRAALGWFGDSGIGSQALRLAAALWRFWYLRGHLSEGRRWLERALDAEAGPSRARAQALTGAAVLARHQSALGAALELSEAGRVVAAQIDDRQALADSLSAKCAAEHIGGDYEAADRDAAAALALYRELGDSPGVARVLYHMGFVAWKRGQQALARELFGQSLRIAREVASVQATISALAAAGWIALHAGDQAGAAVALEEAAGLAAQAGDRWNLARAVYSLGLAASGLGRQASARSHLRRALALAHELGDSGLESGCLEALAGVAAAQRRPAQAVRLLGAAARVAEGSLATRPEPLRPAHAGLTSTLRAQLGDREYDTLWEEGGRTPVADALEEPPPVEVVQAGQPAERLTSREVAVLRLVAQGLTTAEVAHRLRLSPRTVDAHLRTIYRKLNVGSRSAATRYAVEHRIV